MLRIGDFSKLSRVSIRMLRHYDKIGLLVPEEVDESTGYRYYSESQLPLAEKIQVLKTMGFGLSVIGEILVKYEDAEEIEQFLQIKREELLCQAQETEQRIRLLDNTIQWLRKDGNFMDYNVVLKTLPRRYVASVRQVIPAYNFEGMLWELLNKEIAGQDVRPAVPCYGLAVFHDKGFKESDVDVEIQISVSGTYQDTENVRFKDVDAMEIASVTYKGSYEQLTRVNKAVAEWICENGYDFNGASLCIYHVSPHDAETPEELVTEVCYPVKKKN